MKTIYVHAGYRTNRCRFDLNKKITLACDHCKVLFSRFPSNAQLEHHYCSMKCYRTAKKLLKPEQEKDKV
jgi:ribosomal protein L33